MRPRHLSRRAKKSYADCIDEIQPKELYSRLLLYGLFSEKLPPVFDGKLYSGYCRRSERPPFAPDPPSAAVSYQSVRHNNKLRPLNIPTPMSHERLIALLRDHWAELQAYFRSVTTGQKYPISRVHVRKLQTHNSLFALNYHNFRSDGYPDFDLQIGANYLVNSDITHFFNSLAPEQIAAALQDSDLKDKHWPAVLARRIRDFNASAGSSSASALDPESRPNSATNLATSANLSASASGLPIGPHVSNLLSEIVLCKVDAELYPRWRYVRNIDDFHAYVQTSDEADAFLAELAAALGKRGLEINQSKTGIEELPLALVNSWPYQLRDYVALIVRHDDKIITTSELQAIVDFSTRLMLATDNDAAVINYMLSIINKYYINPYSSAHLGQALLALAYSRPYLVPLLCTKFFATHPKARQELFPRYAGELYQAHAVSESRAYLLYYAAQFHHPISAFRVANVIETNDCILLLCALIYARHFARTSDLETLHAHAESLLAAGLMDAFWPFIFEALPASQLPGDWQLMKQAGVSFLRPDLRE